MNRVLKIEKLEVSGSTFGFSKLIVYQKALLFYINIKKMSDELKLNKIHKDQLIRAALSIPLNIAESSGRSGPKDRRRFLVIARGSLFECAALLDVLLIENQLTNSVFEKIMLDANEISKILFVMTENLRKKYSKGKNEQLNN